MDTKINFLKIGIFISTFLILLIVTIFWLGKYGFENKKFDEYSTFFNESVSGLNIGSSIKYMGFEVGSVKEIKINPNNSEEIQIDLLIKKDTPIKEDNFAILGNIGITGLKYIELKGGSNEAKLLRANENGVKIIASKVSALSTLVDSTEDITNELLTVLNGMKKVLNEENLKNFSQLLKNSEKSMDNIEKFSTYLIQNEKKLDDLIFALSKWADKGVISFAAIKKSANTFNSLSTEFRSELKKGSFDIKDMSEESFNNLNSVLKSLEITLLQLQNLINDMKESPSDLILKQRSIKYGPGENDEK